MIIVLKMVQPHAHALSAVCKWCMLIWCVEIDLKKASKQFAQRFSCGSSVTGEDEIVVQGEVAAEMLDFIQQTWPEV